MILEEIKKAIEGSEENHPTVKKEDLIILAPVGTIDRLKEEFSHMFTVASDMSGNALPMYNGIPVYETDAVDKIGLYELPKTIDLKRFGEPVNLVDSTPGMGRISYKGVNDGRCI